SVSPGIDDGPDEHRQTRRCGSDPSQRGASPFGSPRFEKRQTHIRTFGLGTRRVSGSNRQQVSRHAAHAESLPRLSEETRSRRKDLWLTAVSSSNGSAGFASVCRYSKRFGVLTRSGNF